ncbi:DNA cytosine methyltransferase [Pseudoclavibacter sp. CFCC 11306]|uniref:DNA cytosine methyltransferase n=1 Tax=Pseudoclavibacter sp. CFCC 11306 TaxID=1564493 RepID=UPI001CE3D4CC|nr:DNA (cytosine-5-)-methyltransferase [Pseudoclavibacter sp. CFCC 11306]
MLDTDHHDRPLQVGSLFSGYGGLDLAVEHVFNAETVWFSEINEPVARVFAHHWPDAHNLGDIATINWSGVPALDILCGGFPCQDVSTVGKQAGLAPGTRSGLWSHMAEAIDVLKPQLVVIENVRGLLSSPAVRAPLEEKDDAQRDPEFATHGDATVRNLEPDSWGLGDFPARPLRAAGAVLGDLADLGMDARWIGLPASLVDAPHHRYRIFIFAHRRDTVSYPAGLGLSPWQRNTGSSSRPTRHHRSEPSGYRHRTERTAWLASQVQRVRDPVEPDSEHLRRWGGIRPCDSPLGAHHRTTSPITDAPERHGRSEAVAGVCGVAHGPPIWMG